jgi:hypothetical protein
MTHPTDTIARYEACTAFREGDDLLVCACGWLEDDHPHAGATVVAIGARRPPAVSLPARRAS